MAGLTIRVLSQGGLQRLAASPFERGTFLVSVTDTDALPVRLANAPAGILRLSFDDVYPMNHPLYKGCFDGDEGEDYAAFFQTLKLMSEEQAEQVARFVTRNLASMRMLVCQCGFGQSRSPAIAAAVSEWLYGDSLRFFDDERYAPNRHVYKLVLGALYSSDCGSARQRGVRGNERI